MESGQENLTPASLLDLVIRRVTVEPYVINSEGFRFCSFGLASIPIDRLDPRK